MTSMPAPARARTLSGVFVHPFPHEEEGRLHAVAAQDIYELGRVLVAPGGVEAQRNVLPVPLHAVHGQAALTAEAPTTAGAFTAASIAAAARITASVPQSARLSRDEMHYIP